MSAIVEVRGGAASAARRACLLLLSVALGSVPAHAASKFPDIPVWMNVGAWQDSSQIEGLSFRCVGSFQGPLPDSLREQNRVLTVRFLRDRATEDRPDFGGYRIYRMTNSPDSSRAVLIRRFSLNAGSELTWSASRATRTSSVSALLNDGIGGLEPRIKLTCGLTPSAITVGDMNLDGNPDLVSANQGENSISVLFGNGSGGVLRRGDFNVGLPPSDVKLLDMNGDGKVDVAAASASDPLFTVIPADSATGNLRLAVSKRVPAGPTALAVGDVNRDGFPDCILACAGADTIVTVLGRRTPGGFTPPFASRDTFTVCGPRPVALALGDVDGDNILDLAVANAGNNTVSVFKGDGTARFTGRTDFPTGNSPSGVVLRDVSGDGRLDLMVTNQGSNTVTVLLGNGAGGFTPVADVPTGTGPRAITTADMNADGKIDLVVANEGSNDVSVLQGDGAGGFPFRDAKPTGVHPRGIAVGDLDRDSRTDVFTADFAYELPYICNSTVVNDSILTFVDPDSNGRYVKVCRRPGTGAGRCESPGDSIFILVAPPGPHDGFQTWYSITIERRNTTDPDYEDLFVPDTLDNFARCSNPSDRNTCPNLNNKLNNLTGAAEPTPGPTANLEKVLAVPNPYRGSEVWDQPGQSEVHFINLPTTAKIRIYTAAGDLVRELFHNDKVRDFERWDLKNASGQAVASGIYMYRVESGLFHFQSRLVVIR